MFKHYTYGYYKKEIKRLLRKRLSLKDKIRHHLRMGEKSQALLVKVEHDLEVLLQKAKR